MPRTPRRERPPPRIRWVRVNSARHHAELEFLLSVLHGEDIPTSVRPGFYPESTSASRRSAEASWVGRTSRSSSAAWRSYDERDLERSPTGRRSPCSRRPPP